MKLKLSLKEGIFIKDYYPEFMFSLYCFLFSLVKPFTQPTGYAAPLLFVITAVCALLLIYKTHKIGLNGNFKTLYTCLFIVLILLFSDLTFRYNENTTKYLYNYFLYGVLSLFFIAYVRNYRAVLYYFSIIAVINGLLYLADPIFNQYELSGGYMQFGFNSMMPAFSGAVVILYYFSRKWAWLFVGIFLMSLFIFANKSAFLCALLILAFGYLYLKKRERIGLTPIIILITITILLLLNANKLVLLGSEIASGIGFTDSYALRTFEAMLVGAEDMVLGARYDVWDEAIAMYNQNLEFGWGVGWFEKFSDQPYPHNIVLEVMVEYGLIGTIVFLSLIHI